MREVMLGQEPDSRQPFVIIGGTSGIGAAVREQLESSGESVFCFSRSSEPAVDVRLGVDGLPKLEALRGLLYCPGSIPLKPFEQLRIEDFKDDIEINFLGAVRVLQHYADALKQSGRGSVVFFSTVAVSTGMPFHTSIAAAKGALEAFARAVAAELAPVVRVNVIAPSLTETPLSARLLRNERQREAAVARHPMKRFGHVRDLADAACFLLTTQSSWITGQVLHVDGGLSTLRPL